ncbi:anti-sigma-F factor Fin [Paenibacillus pasadenensis]|uniref:Anti-sigma-F factor Fin family protein n=2 Tax=Paenibacillus TaxID=44249 RepID=A0A6H2GSR1_9BACL|nr:MULTISPECIES: anti-sigma-F factor Fin family protein [Paenibacillus]PLT47879.1 Fin: required for the switch from sigmaF to sigmaG during sporulation [Paenibacillus pasadenensis]QGG54195.1 DUF2757 family protein [Paenibacillus sp. B01]QJC50188.1 anti-sigma-F factor Fin family protein [Paenibacillus albicereus]
MAIHYECRHCRTPLGTISSLHGIPENRLGLHFLTLEERSDIIAYNPQGDMVVKLVCDYCSEAALRHPELLLVSSPLQ